MDNQRREGYRIHPLMHCQPMLRLRHPSWPEQALRLYVVDLAHSGLSILFPDNMALPPPSTLVPGVWLDLEPGLAIPLTLRVVHQLPVESIDQHTRLGCEILHLCGEHARALQRYINRTQVRSSQALV
jgi:c-di-GMP-binding flagellar brake protein YcgR